MNTLIVEKTVVERGKPNVDYYAVATSEPNPHSIMYSLTFEGHLTPWNADRGEVEALQAQIKAEGAEP